VEDFTCSHCGKFNETLPSGTRNHCKYCLHSLHVDDLVPGDRASMCKGLMKPIGAEQKDGQWRVIQKCQKCGHVWKNRLVTDDNFDVLINVMENNAGNHR